MKKIVSCQVPKAKIVLPLVAGGVLLSLAAGGAEAQTYGCTTGAQQPSSPPVTTTSPLQTAISGSLGCVSGAQQAQQAQPTKK